ncbi:MAG: hypothetical protein NZM00_13585, partial [Anaerolinea sp.]|nr:hypothetical protein [Anaerolinea sp.]
MRKSIARVRALALMIAVSAAVVSCQPQAPTIIYIVVSPTPEITADAQTTAEITAETTVELTDATTAEPTRAPTETPNRTATAQARAAATQVAATQASEATAVVQATALAQAAATQVAIASRPTETIPPTIPLTPSRTPLPPAFPTPIQVQIQVAEQVFENGRMYWLQPTGEIWVLVLTGEGRGTWSVYPDTYVDGELLPTVAPAPQGLLIPERGFGKLWRESATVRNALGYAITPEFGYISPYEYHAGGTVDAQGNYIPGPGYH